MATRDRRDIQGMTRRPSAASPATRDPYGPGGVWPDPWSQFRRLSEQMDRWFESFGSGRSTRSSGNLWAADNWAPEMETFLRDDQFVIRMDLPGLSKDDVNVEVTEDSVVIHGERQNAHEESREGYYRSERSYGRFYRDVPLPEGAQVDSAKANYKDGVLEITVTAPPRQLNSPRRIEIGSSLASERDERQRASSPSPTGATTGSMPIKDRTTSTGRSSVAHDKGNE